MMILQSAILQHCALVFLLSALYLVLYAANLAEGFTDNESNASQDLSHISLDFNGKAEEHRLLGRRKENCPAKRTHHLERAGELNPSNEVEHIGLAVSVSADGTRMAVLNKLGNDPRASDGVVRVYDEVRAGVWEQVGDDFSILGCFFEECDEFEGEGPVAQWGYFTGLVSLSGNGKILAIASPYSDFDDFYGRVDIFQWNGVAWENMTDEDFGIDLIPFPILSRMVVSLSHTGKRMALGVEDTGSDFNFESGAVYMYSYNKGKGWHYNYPHDIIFAGETELKLGGIFLIGDNSALDFGGMISFSGDGKRLAVLFTDKVEGDYKSFLRVYDRDKGTWKRLGKDIKFADGILQGNMGTSINHDGSIVAAGPRVFKLKKNKSTWYQLGDDIRPVSRSDDWSVSLSASGYRIALANPGRRKLSGRVQIFDYKDGKWCKVAQELGREVLIEFGESLSLSGNGNRFAAGAPDPQGLTFTESYLEVYDINEKK